MRFLVELTCPTACARCWSDTDTTLSASKGSAVQFPNPCTEMALARLAAQKSEYPTIIPTLRSPLSRTRERVTYWFASHGNP